jgi:Uma2 family endonuclease
MNFEMTKEGTVHMMTPSGNETSDANAEIITQLRIWWHTHRQGRVFDSNTNFQLPDGSKKGPDAAYISAGRLAQVPREALRRFAPVCPNFVIELMSPSDTEDKAMEKMQEWIANGVELGWLINPEEKRSYSFMPDGHVLNISALELHGHGPVDGFVLDLTEVWRAYE